MDNDADNETEPIHSWVECLLEKACDYENRLNRKEWSPGISAWLQSKIDYWLDEALRAEFWSSRYVATDKAA